MVVVVVVVVVGKQGMVGQPGFGREYEGLRCFSFNLGLFLLIFEISFSFNIRGVGKVYK